MRSLQVAAIVSAVLGSRGCGTSHSREADDAHVSARDARGPWTDAAMSVDAAMEMELDAGTVHPVECVIGEAHLMGRAPFGDAAELVFAWADVVECWGADEITLWLSSTADRTPQLGVYVTLPSGALRGGFSGGPFEARFWWEGLSEPPSPGMITILEIHLPTPRDVGWVTAELTIDDPMIDLAGTLRASYCEVPVCI